MSKVKTLVIRAPGTNCDSETIFSFQQAGSETSLVHINQLIQGKERLDDYYILVSPGGFTYGDDIAAGKVLANEFKLRLGEAMIRFIGEGKLILGICNGFQVLVKSGFLPEPSNNGSSQLTLGDNDSGRFECRWVHLVINEKSPCVFTRGLEKIYLPVAHGEGKVVTSADVLIDANIALFYADENGNINAGYPDNPNGSLKNIAGICDSTGRIFGLMPHPERHIRGTQHPQWTRIGAGERGDGFQIFKNAVEWAEKL